MTIVATKDTRNAAWASDTSSFGRKMLAKMGWKEGKGLGKEQQGQTTHLRAVRRGDSLGIGAETDTHGEKGWNETSQNFHGVLAALKETHGSASGGDDSDSSRSVKKKENKRHRGKREKDESKKKRKRRLERKGSGLVLAQNKVTAGHAKKMRNAKDVANKSSADMAAVFGVKVDQYERKQKSVRVTNFSSNTASSSLVVESTETEEKSVKRVRVSKVPVEDDAVLESVERSEERMVSSRKEKKKDKSKKKRSKVEKKVSKKEKKRKSKKSPDSTSPDEGCRERKSKKRRTE
mmetsp:Transcript_59042/g.175562  ORF Transcript_59042/g.175562 Transcript_59042/m.175562 type:complete len:292 (-) Transcript_59042:323-1198(-)